jgi:hypothetical protein
LIPAEFTYHECPRWLLWCWWEAWLNYSGLAILGYCINTNGQERHGVFKCKDCDSQMT